MRIKELSARHFGLFDHLDAPVDAPLVVFLGPNEAGKSTVREMITALLFGFEKKQKGAAWKPLIRWGAAESTLSARVMLASGSEIDLQRVISERRPVFQVLRGGTMQEMGNTPLPDVGAITREIFESIYCLTSDRLVFPADTWSQVQDRLLGMEVFENLHPALDVAQALEEEAQALWRNDNRGRPAARELARQREALRQTLSEARERQHRLTRLSELRAQRHMEVERLRAGIRDSEAFLREAEVWRELRSRMERIRRMEQEAGDLTPFEVLPEDIAGHMQRLEESEKALSARVEEARSRLADLRATEQAFTDAHRRLLEKAPEIEQVSGLSVQYLDDGQEIQQVRQELEQEQAVYRQAVLSTLESTPDNLGEVLSRVNVQELQRAVAALRDARKVHATLESQKNEPSAAPLPRLRWPVWVEVLSILLLLAGIVMAPPLAVPGWPVQLPMPLPWVGAGALVLGVGGLAAASIALARNKRLRRHALNQSVEQAARAVDMARNDVLAALHGLSIPAARLEAADEALPLAVERLQERSRRIEQLTGRLHALEQRYHQNGDRIARLIEDCLGRSPEDISGDIETIRKQLHDARELGSRHDAAKAEAQRLEKDLAGDEEQQASLRRQIAETAHVISLARGVDMAASIAQINHRRALRRTARAERDALMEDSRFASRMAKLPLMETQWPYDDNVVAETRAYADNAAAKLGDIGKELGRMDQEFASLQQLPTPADIQSQIEALEREEQDMGLTRDRYALAAAVIKAGRRQFQEQHQPDVIRRAAEYLSLVTGGRYNRLMLLEDGSSLQVYSQEAGRYLDPERERLSRGSLAQLYLSLRLALLDNLDPPGEPLPLLLDEALVDWDDERLNRGLQWLSRFSRNRQVFLFTCHDALANSLEEECPDALIFRLNRA